jgi:hypothetical protein
MEDTAHLLAEIRDALTAEEGYYVGSSGSCTRRTHEIFGRLAQSFASAQNLKYGPITVEKLPGRRLAVYHTGGWLDYSGCEFLFDHCWLTEYSNTVEAENGYVIKCNLAMECEWHLSGEAIHNDFQKLVIAKADAKVMIFNSRTKEEGEKSITELKTQIWICEQCEEGRNSYLLSYFSWGDNRFHHHLGGP